MVFKLKQFTNCRILRNHKIYKEDLWIRNGKIINPEKVFFDEKVKADLQINCNNAIIAPGFIELQINGQWVPNEINIAKNQPSIFVLSGGFGYDFSYTEDTENGINVVAKGLLSHGVTSFCPTVVTSPKEVYHRVLKKIKKRCGSRDGATVLGIHVEGPFINIEKKGAHPPQYIRNLDQVINLTFRINWSLWD